MNKSNLAPIHLFQLSPTVVLWPNHDEKADAQKLREAMKASNENQLIEVICRRTNSQRLVSS
jgi:Annexin